MAPGRGPADEENPADASDGWGRGGDGTGRPQRPRRPRGWSWNNPEADALDAPVTADNDTSDWDNAGNPADADTAGDADADVTDDLGADAINDADCRWR